MLYSFNKITGLCDYVTVTLQSQSSKLSIIRIFFPPFLHDYLFLCLPEIIYWRRLLMCALLDFPIVHALLWWKKAWALYGLFSIWGPSALTQMLGSHCESKDYDQRLRGTGKKSMKGVKKQGDSLLPPTGEPRSGITLCSRKDILIYKLRMFWSPTAEIDLVVHLIQLKSEFENSYVSRADSQLHFCSPALQFLLSVFPPHP